MIDTAALGFALGAGLVAAFNPCGFAFLPGYLGLIIVRGQDASRATALVRAAAATVAMAAGFLTVFGLFGLLVSPLIASVQQYLPFGTVVIGLVLIGLAAWLLAGRELLVVMPKMSGDAPTTHLGTMYTYGLGYAVASLSCTIAPFLAVIGTTFKQGSILNGVLAFVMYALGMTITVGVAALTVALAGTSAAGAFRRVLPHVGRIAGVIVLLTGLYVTYYGYYEIRLYFQGADPDDPIVTAAGTVQTFLIRQVDNVGVWPFMAVFCALVAGAAIWRMRARRHRMPTTGGSGSAAG
jgi:cytochrome c biogenesis protein CcdA